MITLTRCYDEEIIRNILYREDMCGIIFTGSDSINEITRDSFKFEPQTAYMVLKEDDTTKGAMSVKVLTSRIVEVHVGIFPEHWGTGLSDEMVRLLIKHLKEQTRINHITTSCPKICQKVIGALLRTGWSVQSIYKDGIVYYGQLSDLLIFSKTIQR